MKLDLTEVVEGDRNDWHIRRVKKLGEIETWRLFFKDTPQSSQFPKNVVLQWMHEEIKKRKQ
ncbi:MAG TPA: hypothetical protein VNL14_16535 [Candidatus Acidoferrales bacterium]|nr:hypothetical protein [Candidatus Acidoferrales bacterium]